MKSNTNDFLKEKTHTALKKNEKDPDQKNKTHALVNKTKKDKPVKKTVFKWNGSS